MTTDWWRDAVIYQIYPRSFRDSNGDGIGDLNGIRERLGYLAELGADAIWICPFVQSPMRDFGYDVSDFQAIEPMFGTMDDFDALVREAHMLGLRVIMDQVWNHTSDEHEWFVESRSSRDNPKADWYVWADASPDGGPPNNWRATFGGSAWTWDPLRGQYYLHNFLSEQPDLNFYKREVRAALNEVARFWLDRGVDGFRLDVVNFYTHDRSLRDNPRRPADVPRPAGAGPRDRYFDYINRGTVSRPETLDLLGELRSLMDSYPGTFTLGEISSAEDTLASAADFVRGNRRLHTAYNASLISHEPFTQQTMSELLQRVVELFEDHRICWTFGTHDFPRLKGRWAQHRRHDEETEHRLDRLLAAMLVCLPGSCCIYQGDELGLPQAQLSFEQLRDPYGIANYPEILGRDGCRTPMPWCAEADTAGFSDGDQSWLPIPAEHLPLAVDRQQQNPGSLLNAYRHFLHWRKTQPGLRSGALSLIGSPPPVLMFERGRHEERLLCVFNLSTEPAEVTINERGWHLCHEPLLQGRLIPPVLHLGAYGSAILGRRPPDSWH
ncbi:alpha glucosidase [Algiphilus sp. W345]|uniref:Alpha glucosidase n=1 Tax=Banduia mediterranea TaxID=3075609 RepID=A0ABU2WLI4_9GAMM|nr:alpha glucosidase [Algiphilus sp. W345]MDT0498742.1 alpha glucosidase [Algiphilus sp. W345]